MHNDRWEEIVEIHNLTKELILRFEEVDPERKAFFNPMLQQRDAYDHIVRAKVAELGRKEFENETERIKYIDSNFDKALGHAYRAFFDAADWLSIIYRDNMNMAVDGYSAEAVNTAVPDFYETILPRTEKAHNELVDIRKNKDIGTGAGILEQVHQYRTILDRMDEDWRKITDAKISLIKLKGKETAKKIKTAVIQLAIGIAIGILLMILKGDY